MSKPKKVKVVLEQPIILNDEGLPELMQKIQESVAEGDDATSYQVTGLIMEVEPAAGEPQPLKGEADLAEGESKVDEESTD